MSHDKFLLAALEQAKLGLGQCAPNPPVGAVIVKDHKIIAKAYHQGPGTEHAEIAALSQCSKEQLKDTLVYITLEPCNHWGNTPPCTESLINTNIAGVVFAFKDPNHDVKGDGAAALYQAGKLCLQQELPEINEFYRAYAYWCAEKKPLVTAKIALSLDGKIAASGGKPVAITGAALKHFTHQKRAEHDAILTTVNTVNNDDPQLNVRLNEQTITKPIYILDSDLNLKADLQIFDTAKAITIFHAPGAKPKWIKDKVTYIAIERDTKTKRLALEAVLAHIGQDGQQQLWVEAGGQLFESLLQQSLLQRAYIYIAAKTLGSDAQSAFSLPQDLVTLANKTIWHPCGGDVVCELVF